MDLNTEFLRIFEQITKNPLKATQDGKITDLRRLIKENRYWVKSLQRSGIITVIINQICSKSQNASENEKIAIVDALSVMLQMESFEGQTRDRDFFALFIFLLQEICDPKERNNLKSISEEYKLSVITCVGALLKSVPWALTPVIYRPKNVMWFCSMVHVCLNLAKNEKLRTLRIAAIDTLLIMAKMDDDTEITDNNISGIFICFLPGIIGALTKIISADEKQGHKVVCAALKAFGQFASILFKGAPEDAADETVEKKELKTAEDVNEYMNSMKKNKRWFATHDEKLEACTRFLNKLTGATHVEIKRGLVKVCDKLISSCMVSLPKTTSSCTAILIALSEDDDSITSGSSRVLLYGICERLSGDNEDVSAIRENLEHGFNNTIIKLPRIFNGLDRNEQLITMNLLIGYLSIFSEHRLKQILFSVDNLNRLIISLLHVAALKSTEVSVLEDYTPLELDLISDKRTPWKTFNFQERSIQTKLEALCRLIAKQEDASEMVLDYLMDVFMNDSENRKEATVLINEILSVSNKVRIKSTIATYLEPQYWELKLSVCSTENDKCTLGEVTNNITQLCLQLEGIGKMALALNDEFSELLLKVLYVVLEKAGSNHPLLRAAGMTAVTNISIACGYKNVTELINNNSDYFAYHVMCKLKRAEPNEGVFKVLSVVMKHTDIDVLPSISEIVDGVLVQSCDKYQLKNADLHLKVFQLFVKSVHRWLNIIITEEPIKSRQQKERDFDAQKSEELTELYTDFSDDKIMDKTADELWMEDISKTKAEIEEELEPTDERYEKPEPPTYIKLTVSVLRRSLNFLPSKEADRKILVLEILKDGVEVLKNWEDELLPIVHLIWSPLVDRFKEYNVPLIINLSFRLLGTLARLSKDFIRHRTVKDAFPYLKVALIKQAKESYLKDKGSAYRYTQGYKMQMAVLSGLGRLMYDLDCNEKGVDMAVEMVAPYLSERQPYPLQEFAISFYKVMALTDEELPKQLLLKLHAVNDGEFTKNVQIVRSILENDCKLLKK